MAWAWRVWRGSGCECGCVSVGVCGEVVKCGCWCGLGVEH